MTTQRLASCPKPVSARRGAACATETSPRQATATQAGQRRAAASLTARRIDPVALGSCAGMAAGHESSHALRRSERWLHRRLESGDPLWPPQLAGGTAIVVNLALSEKVTIGPNWLLPAVETVLLLVLFITTRGVRATRHLPAR